MKIALFHYHLRPGGVTDVIVHSSKALLTLKNDLDEIRLVTGDREGAEDVLERIRNSLDRRTADKLRLDILEDIGYTTARPTQDAEMLTQRLLARYSEETLWWIHNYHLGKNPVFTQALMNVARTGSRDMLLHIHDFPECGRHKNMANLKSTLKEPPYPTGPRIRYAAINGRDRTILAEAGLGDSAHLLTNPVPLPPVSSIDTSEVRKAMAENFSGRAYKPDAPILLYPVRAIRRKNILEAALFTRLLGNPANLIVTLPGTSEQERNYSKIVEDAYTDSLISGAWCPEASGDERLCYSNLAASCDAVMSTSIQEGFGYLFLNTLHWRKPLLARYLDILGDILHLFGDYPRRFWADFRVPADKELTERVQNTYMDKIETLAGSIPEKALKSMTVGVRKIASAGGIDVSYLSVDDQLRMLEMARDSTDWLETARLLNRELLESADRTIQACPPDMDDVIEKHFGSRTFVRNFTAILSDFGTERREPDNSEIQMSILRAFGRLDYYRLIYDY